MVERFGDAGWPEATDAVGNALLAKGGILKGRGRFTDALAAFEEAVDRFASSTTAEAARHWAATHCLRGSMPDLLGRSRAARESYDAVIGRCSPHEGSDQDREPSCT